MSFTSAKSRNNSDTRGFQATLCFGPVAYQGRHIYQTVPLQRRNQKSSWEETVQRIYFEIEEKPSAAWSDLWLNAEGVSDDLQFPA